MGSYRTENVAWLELVPGMVIVGKGGQLNMVTAAGWERPGDDFGQGRFIVEAQCGFEMVKRVLTPEAMAKHLHVPVLVPMVVDVSAALAAAETAGTVITP